MHVTDKLTEHFRLNNFQKEALERLGLETIEDLLYHFPSRYGDTASMRNIGTLSKGDAATLFGKISGLKTLKAFRKKIPMAEGILEDDTGKIKLIWFNQAYIAKLIPEGSFVRIDGKVLERKGELYISNPKIETVATLPIGVGDSLFGEGGESHALYPVYPESRGISSNWIYHTLQKIFKSGLLEHIPDPLPAPLLEKYTLPRIATALVWIHAPKNENDAAAARKRFAFEEVFFIQIERQKQRKLRETEPAFAIEKSEAHIEEFVSRFPFQATAAQKRAIEEIFADFKKGHAMGRLLEGDVGSGKTAVAATTAYAAVTTRPKGQDFGALQVAYMAPTEILAAQHFESFTSYFTHFGINVGLITGSGCKKFPSKINPKGATDISRAQLLKWVQNGEIPILIGTHALIQKSVQFKNLAYVVIDEQHRFGIGQRQKLVTKKGMAPHLLSMTATPIPRTLALTIYGDLDLSLLDEMPHGRKPIHTEIVLPGLREATYEKIRVEIKNGRQVFIICPRIDEPDPTKEQALNAKSVKAEALFLKKKVFPEYHVDVLHGKMTPAAKDKAMADFKNGKTHILVATSVVEVGVNVPNATVIVIEGAERFGLAQLHQLRGRVIRSSNQAYCYVFTESQTEKTITRLKALSTAKNGFELAEYDLKFRGAGELSGNKQWGVSDLAMEAMKNLKMVEAARTEARAIIEEDFALEKHPAIASRIALSEKIHFE